MMVECIPAPKVGVQ